MSLLRRRLMMESAKDEWKLLGEVATEEDLNSVDLHENPEGEYTKYRILGDFKVETDSFRVVINNMTASAYSLFNINYDASGRRVIDVIVEPNENGTPYGHGTCSINNKNPTTSTRDPNNPNVVNYPITKLSIRGNTKKILMGAKFIIYGQK